MPTSRFIQAKSEIIIFFDKQSKSIFSLKDMSDILDQGQRYWKLPASYTVTDFIDQTLKHLPLKKKSIISHYRAYPRYVWKEAPKYVLYLSLIKGSYFTHHTAIFLHNLIDKEPKTIYLNFEQSNKPHLKDGQLSQEGIDMAFDRPQRLTKNIADFEGDKIFILNGQHTNKAGVEKIKTSYGELTITNLERTLVDIVVRQDYAGGLTEVVTAYKRAKDKISTEKILTILKQLKFIYPYHQAIGFLLQRIGLNDPETLKPFKVLGMKFDFYLARQMKEPSYSEEWKLYYPKNLS